MSFEEYLEKAGYTSEQYQTAPHEVQQHLFVGYQIQVEKMQKEAEAQEKEWIPPDNPQEERQKEEYQLWEKKFEANINDPMSNIFSKVGENGAESALEVEADYRRRVALRAARRSTNDPEKLVFAEAQAMENSMELESLERCIPVGDDFAEMLDAVKNSMSEGETLSEAMKNYAPYSIRANMYSHLLRRVDNDPGIMERSADGIMYDICRNNDYAASFYHAHKYDDKPVANPENVKHTFQEMFRLGERMSRNSRMSAPMKELCGKINGLKKAFEKDEGKFMKMPRRQLDNLISSVMFSADAYTKDKSSLKSFSSTQLERLKCINQLKSLQNNFLPNANKPTEAFKNVERNNYVNGWVNRNADNNNGVARYSNGMVALAEKLVLNSYIDAKKGASMCNYLKVQIRTLDVVGSQRFQEYVKLAMAKEAQARGDKFSAEKVYDHLLKSDGQKLLKNYRTFVQKMKKDGLAEETKAPTIKNTAKVPVQKTAAQGKVAK